MFAIVSFHYPSIIPWTLFLVCVHSTPMPVAQYHPTNSVPYIWCQRWDAYPRPRLDYLIETVGRQRPGSSPHSIYVTGFGRSPWQKKKRTPQGLWKFTKMPFGLHWAPVTFQHLMDRVLSGTSYWGYIGIYNQSLSDHTTHIKDSPARDQIPRLRFGKEEFSNPC